MNRLSDEFWPFPEYESLRTLFQWMSLLFINTEGIVYAKELQSLGFSRTAWFFKLASTFSGPTLFICVMKHCIITLNSNKEFQTYE